VLLSDECRPDVRRPGFRLHHLTLGGGGPQPRRRLPGSPGLRY